MLHACFFKKGDRSSPGDIETVCFMDRQKKAGIEEAMDGIGYVILLSHQDVKVQMVNALRSHGAVVDHQSIPIAQALTKGETRGEAQQWDTCEGTYANDGFTADGTRHGKRGRR